MSLSLRHKRFDHSWFPFVFEWGGVCWPFGLPILTGSCSRDRWARLSSGSTDVESLWMVNHTVPARTDSSIYFYAHVAGGKANGKTLSVAFSRLKLKAAGVKLPARQSFIILRRLLLLATLWTCWARMFPQFPWRRACASLSSPGLWTVSLLLVLLRFQHSLDSNRGK